MRPVNGTFSVRNPTCDFIQEIRRWDGAIERSYEVSRESVKCLGRVMRRRKRKKEKVYPG